MISKEYPIQGGLSVEVVLHEYPYPVPGGMMQEAKISIGLDKEDRPVEKLVTPFADAAIHAAVRDYLKTATVDLATADAFIRANGLKNAPVEAPWKQKMIRNVWNDVLEPGGGFKLCAFQSGPGKNYVAILYGDRNRILFKRKLTARDRAPALTESIREFTDYTARSAAAHDQALRLLRKQNPFDIDSLR